MVLDVILGIDPVLKLFSLLLALLEVKNLKLVKKFTKSDSEVSKLEVTIPELCNRYMMILKEFEVN